MEKKTIAEILALSANGTNEQCKEIADKYPLLVQAKPREIMQVVFGLISAEEAEHALENRTRRTRSGKREQGDAKLVTKGLPTDVFARIQQRSKELTEETGKRELKTQPIIVRDANGNILEERKPQGRPPKQTNLRPIYMTQEEATSLVQPEALVASPEAPKTVERSEEKTIAEPEDILNTLELPVPQKVKALEYVPMAEEGLEDWESVFR